MRIIEELVKLAGHLAWPISLLVIIFVIRTELKDAFKALTRRMSDPSSDISIGKEGLAIKTRVDAALGRIESLETIHNQSKELILGVLGKRKEDDVESKSEASNVIDPELMELADNYLRISANDWAERVRLKDETATKMASLIITRNIPKDLLAAQNHEGLIMGLVTAIHAAPDTQDFARISRVAHKVKRLHIKYRIAMALGRIFEQNLATGADVGRALEILDQYNVNADESLRHRITQTRAIIDLAKQRLSTFA